MFRTLIHLDSAYSSNYMMVSIAIVYFDDPVPIPEVNKLKKMQLGCFRNFLERNSRHPAPQSVFASPLWTVSAALKIIIASSNLGLVNL